MCPGLPTSMRAAFKVALVVGRLVTYDIEFAGGRGGSRREPPVQEESLATARCEPSPGERRQAVCAGAEGEARFQRT